MSLTTATLRSQTDIIANHPGLDLLASDERDHQMLIAFSQDLACWMAGGPASELGPLVRVVTRIAGRELQRSRHRCSGNPAMAIEATVVAASVLWPLLRTIRAENAQTPDEPSDDAPSTDEDPTSGHQSEEEAAIHSGAMQDLDERLTESAVRTEAALHDLERMIPGLGWSISPGAVHQMALDDVQRWSKWLAKSPQIHAIADLLGRMTQLGTFRPTPGGGSEEVVGVTMGSRITDALPIELGLLASEVTEDLFYARWLEHRLLTLELSGAGLDGSQAPDGRGPFIVCVDASASMDGEPEILAKATALAFAERAYSEKRACHLILFGGQGQIMEARLDKPPRSVESLLDLLTLTFDGGTDFDRPLLYALELTSAPTFSKADIVIITDGMAEVDSSVQLAMQRAKRNEGVGCYGVIVGDGPVDSLNAVADSVWVLRRKALHGTLPAVATLST